MGTQLPSPKKGTEPPIFGPSLLWPNGWMHQDATWYGGRLSPGDFVLDGDRAPYPKKDGAPPNFRSSSIVAKRLHDQDFTWYRGRPRPTQNCVRCGLSYLEKRAHLLLPNFSPCLLWPNGCMNEDAAWYRSRPRPRPHCTRWGPSSRERGTAAPLFSAHVYCGHGRPSQLLLL